MEICPICQGTLTKGIMGPFNLSTFSVPKIILANKQKITIGGFKNYIDVDYCPACGIYFGARK